jgi:hypothetical protein
MDFKTVLNNIIIQMTEFEDEFYIKLSEQVVSNIILELMDKWPEIVRYEQSGRISEQYIMESLNIVLLRTIEVIDSKEELIKESMYKKALLMKKCDHYPWCERPLNR